MISAIANAAVNNGFVVAMGIGTVFVGLICIILLIKLMSMVTALFTTNAPAQAAPTAPAAAPAPAAPAASTAIENRAEIVAAVCAAAAEEMGTDISALRVVSFKKIS